MLSHEQIWTAIDRLAERHGFSASGLARRAGLDATSFNRSKRVGPDGRKRWPSTESIAKVLAATGASLDDFLHLVDSGQAPARTMVPLVGLTQAGSGRLFTEEGIPTGGPGWDEIEFPDLGDDHAFALEVQGDSMLPLYRDGDVLIVAPNAGIRKGDRIVARLTNGEVLAKELRRRTARTIELASLNPDHEDRMVPLADVAWMARVMWVRQ
ncbi:S24 family peptidase [Methylorubrum aminovorans]|uniref:LexA repressor n=1 Tax=Methylorubrum aminovorans TaxID=269069 RepID=A0ABQ4UF16_9HYPH|nr:helix-turn-helix transcriptional regulator [Methylorubrum aminovorans]AWI88897.1 DNA-binding protein [Methylobacterium sp. DM1]GJE65382.1 LexA repressor [Methylorubrum aminovorans]GMA78658.1 DNA-binding protein [Methylorubrum aminovorans]